jgi:serine protease Do
LQREIAELKAKLAAQESTAPAERVTLEGPDVMELPGVMALDEDSEVQLPEVAPVPGMPESHAENFVFSTDGEGSSWLGVETQEVSAGKAKDLKLASEHGVLVGKVLPESPASKAGLKENDVITEINGQRVEGAAQFRRMIREIPAGRAVQLVIWRDGKQQTVEATLGKSDERHHVMMKTAPQAFHFRVPQMPEIPDVPSLQWENSFLLNAKPRLGIDAEDLGGQLGTYFGAPEGEGILVRSVNSGSPAEKAGVKAGDVITTFNGERIRSSGELREKLAGQDGGKTVKLGVLRNKSSVSLTVELPAPVSKEKRKISLRTTI